MHLNSIVIGSFVLFGVSIVLSSVVRTTGAVLQPLAILFVSLYVLRIPFAVAMLDRLGADAIWWSYDVGSGFSILLTIAYYRYGAWRNASMLAAPLAPARP